MINILKKIIRYTRNNFQTKSSSYLKHNSQYNQVDALNKTIIGYSKNHQDDLINKNVNKVDEFLMKYQDLRNTAVDIGCGGGWASSELSRRFEKVIGIEPSESALKIAKEIYPLKKYPNIEWINDFAENGLRQLEFDKPVFFFSGCVLSHLKDESVIQICEMICKITKDGSGFSFCENWGTEFHDYMWHVRTIDWWRNRFPGWDINFHGPSIEGKKDRFQGLHGYKT